MRITEKAIAAGAFDLPAGKSEMIHFDDDLPGFGLRVRSGGSRTWVFQFKIGDKHRRMSLGTYPTIKVEVARDTAGKLHAKVKLGQDPAGEKAEARQRASETFEPAVRTYLKRRQPKWKPRYYVEVERHLLTDAKPFHGLQIAKIDRRAVAAHLSQVTEGKQSPVAANQLRASLSGFFSWAMREGIAESNPVVGTNRHSVKSRDRVLTNDELREIWNALEDDHYGDIVRLLMLTGQRRDEIGGLRWSEIDLDDETISLPKERTKNRQPHVVPLTASAKAVVKRQKRRLNRDGSPRDLVFGSGDGGFSGWSKTKEVLDQRIFAARKEAPGAARKVKAMDKWRLHDLRRTCATKMAEELGVAPHIIEAILNHISGHKAGVGGVYNKATYTREKREALAGC